MKSEDTLLSLLWPLLEVDMNMGVTSPYVTIVRGNIVLGRENQVLTLSCN